MILADANKVLKLIYKFKIFYWTLSKYFQIKNKEKKEIYTHTHIK